MAYFRKVKAGWRVEVERNGVRRSATRPTKAEAANWAAQEETTLLAEKRGAFPRKTLAEALDLYEKTVSVKKRGKDFEIKRMNALVRDFPKLVGKQISEITTPDLAAWRDARLAEVTPGSVQRDINLFRNVFTVARDEWKWCGDSPFVGLTMPGENPARTRRIHWREVRSICRWLGYRYGHVQSKQQQTALAFLIGLRTGMRAGEILSLSDATVDLEKRVATVAAHKTQHLDGGRPRKIPLTRAAVRLMRQMAGRGDYFTLDSAMLDALFRKARDSLLIEGLHFHDSRGEALTRLARKVDVLTLARISGHKDLRVLMSVYYRETAEQIAARL